MSAKRYADLSPEQKRRRIESTQRWRARNPEKVRAYAISYQQRRNGLPSTRERNRQYHAANRARLNAGSRARYAANRDQWWATWLWSHHGLRPEQWWAIHAEQGGRCYICHLPLPDTGRGRSRGIVIDHDHRCPHPPNHSCARCRRGLAHHACNQAIGLLGDDPERLHTAGYSLADAIADVTRRLAEQPATPALFDASELTAADDDDEFPF